MLAPVRLSMTPRMLLTISSRSRVELTALTASARMPKRRLRSVTSSMREWFCSRYRCDSRTTNRLRARMRAEKTPWMT